MNLFRVRGIQLAVHFSFFALLAVNAFVGWAEAVAADEPGFEAALWSTALILAFFACVVLHELGHSFTAQHYGIGVRRILLLPIGGMAEFDAIPRQPRRELLITLAGPAVNFAIAGLIWVALPKAGLGASEAMTLGDFARLLMQWNLAMGIFNLLPAFPMDGGRILRALLAMRLDYLRATFWAAMTGKTFCAVGIALAAYYEMPMLMGLFAFIFVVGELEYRAVQRREREDAHWRATAARLHATGELLDEPPLLSGEKKKGLSF